MGRIKRSCSVLGVGLTLALRLGTPRHADLRRLLLAALIACLAVSGAPRAAEETRIALETHRLRYCIDPAGRVREFTDLRTGVNHLAPGSSPACARLGRGGEVLQPESARLAEGRLELRFAGVEEPVVLGVRCRDRWIELEVESAAEETDSLLFLDAPLALRGRPSEPFGGCAFALDLRTQVAQLPALQTHLLAKTFRKFGHRGARVAIVGAPPSEMLDIFKDVIRSHPETPQTTASGPWAGDVESSRGSYLFNFGDLTPANVEDWIARVKSLGFTQIDSHGGSSFFRFGDLELNRRKWPRGWEEFREINRRLHDEGIGAIFHTYAFFIDKRAKYVTPVPDARLDAFRSFTLSEAITEDATEIPVVESTRDVSTITGFFVRNSVTLHVGDELITFGGAAQEAPFRFTGCRRGALGTKAAAHAAGAKARHLKECFGLFVPDVDSDLFGEIAASHARIVNECRFDGIYLDAIDGSDILRGSEESWYHASRFVHEIWRHLDRPVGMEMSAMWHHFWKFRSRWQAWDYPTRGHKRFIDIHAASVDGSLLLPLHLGWWNFQTFSPPQVDPSYPDVIEYLGCKLIGFDAGVSLTGAVSAERLRDAPAVRRLVDLLRTYEELRRSGSVGEALKKRLREPGKEFTLERAEDGRHRFRPVVYDRRSIGAAKKGAESWTAANAFGPQPLRARIEVLMSVGEMDDPAGVTIAGFADERELSAPEAAEGVAASLRRAEPAGPDGAGGAAILSARSEGRVAPRAAWVWLRKTFDPPLDLSAQQGLGLRVTGDGSGALLGLRLESPRHIAHGAIADRYVDLDFRGERAVELVETESARHSDHVWPEGSPLYHVYREQVSFRHIESLTILLNNLPAGEDVRCRLGPIRALPLREASVESLTLWIGGEAATFPVRMTPGSYLEIGAADAPDEARLYGPKGELLETVRPAGPLPTLRAGDSEIRLECRTAGAIAPRLAVTIITRGEPL